MSKTAGHTATYVPEKIAILGHVKKCEIGNFTAIGSESQGPVAYVGGSGRDAAYFVTAVNSHASNLRKVEALRDALRLIEEALASGGNINKRSLPMGSHTTYLSIARRALALAEEQL